MRTEQPQTIYLTDYRQPDYWIDETHLTFELFEDHALVHSRLVVRRNSEALTLDSRFRGNDVEGSGNDVEGSGYDVKGSGYDVKGSGNDVGRGETVAGGA